MQTRLSLKNLPLTLLMQLSRIQEPQAGCGCGCILFHIEAGLSEMPYPPFPAGLGKLV